MKALIHQSSLFAVFSCVIATVLLSPAGSASGEIAYRGSPAAFATKAMEGTWCQRGFALSNEGARRRSIKIACITVDRSSRPMQYTRTVTIPPGCQRIVHLAYRAGCLRPLEKAEQEIPGRPVRCRQIYELWDAQTHRKILTKPDQVFKLSPEVTIIAIVEGESVEHDTSSYLRELHDRQLGTVQMLHSRLELLPDRWYGYGLVRILVLGGAEMSRLRASQIEALLQWVRRGGLLVLTGNRCLPEMLQSPLGAAAGVSAAGIHYIDHLEIKGPGITNGQAGLQWVFPLVELCCREQAEVLYEVNGLPLLTRRRLGRGRVFTLAMPLGALAPRRYHEILRHLAPSEQVLPVLNENGFLAPAEGALRSIAGAPSPTVLLPVAILASLVLLAAVAGLLLRSARRGELLWLVLIPLSIVLGVALYGYGSTLSKPQRLSHVGLISSLGGGLARVQAVFAYYSGPEHGRGSFSAGSTRGVIAEIVAAAAALGTGQVRTGATLELPDRQIKPNSTSAFYVDSVEALPGVVSALRFDGKGPSGTIENRFADDIVDAVVYVNGRAYPIGDLPAGSKTDVRTADPPLPPGQFTTTGDAIKNELLRELLNTGPRVSKAAVLIGYTPASHLEPLGRRQIPREGYSVVVWPLELTAPRADRSAEARGRLVLAGKAERVGRAVLEGAR